ncbi:MAG: hypothetical protein JKY56_05510 [Kofleriaceae bacterium]|nr:hypothetical protein [Kofleriaceae bacterium]
MRPPPAVDISSINGAENAIEINWDLPSSRQDDIRFIQVLCARADGSELPDVDGFPLESNTSQAKFLTSLMACDDDSDNAHPTAISVASSARLGPPQPDAGIVDAGIVDAGIVDAGSPDAGTADAGTGPDAGVIDETLPTSLYNLDPKTICGETTGTSTNVRVQGLENGVEYRIVLLMIDDAQNATALDLGTHTPAPVLDGWEHYQESGGNADGGYCFVATATYGNYNHPFVKILRTFRDETLAHSAWGRGFIDWYYDNSPALAAFIAEHPVVRAASYLLLAPLVVFAAVLEYTTLLGKFALLLAFGLAVFGRRRRRAAPTLRATTTRPPARTRALVALASLLLLVGFSATANAQPYWDELNEDLDREDSTPNWNLEIKLGPYHPAIDANVSGGAKPFEEFFGNEYQLMTVVSLDRFFSFPMGQLGITGSLGFSRQSAKAFALDSNGNTIPDPDNNGLPTRADGDTSTFTLIPTSIGAVYRFTELDDKYGIPLVPYGKLALSYYLWKFTAPDGNTSESPTTGCPAPGPGSDCEGNLARGGSFGYQATIGIAVRAERIDPGAALSLRNEKGVELAGFFLEAQLAVVDGFGSDKKLSVGDTNWFAGINFEF